MLHKACSRQGCRTCSLMCCVRLQAHLHGGVGGRLLHHSKVLSDALSRVEWQLRGLEGCSIAHWHDDSITQLNQQPQAQIERCMHRHLVHCCTRPRTHKGACIHLHVHACIACARAECMPSCQSCKLSSALGSACMAVTQGTRAGDCRGAGAQTPQGDHTSMQSPASRMSKPSKWSWGASLLALASQGHHSSRPSWMSAGLAMSAGMPARTCPQAQALATCRHAYAESQRSRPAQALAIVAVALHAEF
jgi:hypothetical protein